MMKTAAILVIGDEILSGKFREENAAFAITEFRKAGISLLKVIVLTDDLDDIADEVSRASQRYDLVITSGGIGPTHDDMTLEGVARAFGEDLVQNDDLTQAVLGFGWTLTDAVLRMVTIPTSSTLNWLDGLRYPVVQVHNVTILPGVPEIFRKKLSRLIPQWAGTALLTERVYVTEYESEIAQRLSEIDLRFPSVSIGSYPRFGETEYRVVITFESSDSDALGKAVSAVRGAMKTL